MPIYEYECVGCGERHEFIQKFSDSPKRKCPDCGKLRLKKLLSAAAFHLKGDGWYVTDFKDKGKKKPDAKAKESEVGKSATEESSTSASETKKTDSPAKPSSDSTDKKSSKAKGGPSKAA